MNTPTVGIEKRLDDETTMKLDSQKHVEPARKTGTNAAWPIVLTYAGFSSLWILLSDKIVAILFSDPATMTLVSMIKGWLFVAVTSLFLFGLIRQLVDGLNHSLDAVSQREKELQNSEGLLQKAQQIAGLGSFVLDFSTGYWKSSAVCDQIFGIDANYVRNVAGWVALVHPDERDILEDYFRNEVLDQGHPFDREYRITRADNGAQRWVHGLGKPERDAHGRLQRMRGTIQDISDRKYAALQIEASRSQLQAILDALPDLLFEVGLDGHIYSYHSNRNDLLAAPPEMFLGKRFADIMPPDVTDICTAAIQQASDQGFSTGQTYALQLPQGERWFELSVSPMRAGKGPDRRFIVIAHDITERKSAYEKLQLAGRVFSHAREGIMVTSASGVILDVNDAFTSITGYNREEVIGRNPAILQSGRQSREFYTTLWRDLKEIGYWSGEIWNRRKNGEVFAELMTISAIRDTEGNTVQYVALLSDITLLKEHQSELERIAHFDALTNLPNRILLSDRLQQAMNQVTRSGQQLAVAYLDIDGFKSVNDTYGHDVGDQLLIALARRMKEALREEDSLARMGGDEFVAVLIDLDNVTVSLPMLTRLLAAASQPVSLDDLTLQVSASLGVTFYPQTEVLDADQLLRQADQAMYQAKLAGKNRYHLFDAEQDSNIRGHHESLAGIQRALDQGEFVLYYQPKVNMRTGQVIGAEALIRWQHPEKGLLAPMVFLPVVEDHPLAVAIGEWVIETALSQIETWRSVGLDIPVSVNVGARQLQQGDFVKRFKEILAAHPLVAPSCLELEILETSALNDMAQVSGVIEACEEIGVKFALDDFGTGYSSLTYLKRLRVAMLKIDQSFVRDMLDNPDDLAILEGVIGLADAFKRGVIAEGVETVTHGTTLLQLGCDLAQGYGIARPMPADAMPSWAATWRPDSAWNQAST
jgi:diguanylate cyclase (GGDEF)-like protein/PAS domain S-box-containing protein